MAWMEEKIVESLIKHNRDLTNSMILVDVKMSAGVSFTDP